MGHATGAHRGPVKLLSGQELLTGPGPESTTGQVPLRHEAREVMGNTRDHESTAQQRHTAARLILTVRSNLHLP